MARQRLEVRVTGRVQGVWFRASTREEARRLGLDGWARNLPDGRVEAVFEGEEAALEGMLAWCRVGPPGAQAEVQAASLVEGREGASKDDVLELFRMAHSMSEDEYEKGRTLLVDGLVPYFREEPESTDIVRSSVCSRRACSSS